jgi:hypothetical protein
MNYCKNILNFKVQITVSQVIIFIPQIYSYPSTLCKNALGANIVATWPQLEQTVSHDTPHAFFFSMNASTTKGRHKNGGTIENRVDYLMRHLPAERKRYTPRTKKQAINAEEIPEMVSFLLAVFAKIHCIYVLFIYRPRLIWMSPTNGTLRLICTRPCLQGTNSERKESQQLKLSNIIRLWYLITVKW